MDGAKLIWRPKSRENHPVGTGLKEKSLFCKMKSSLNICRNCINDN